MNLDVRLPMGLLFAIIGAILVVHGFLADKAIYVQHSLGMNINVRWGFVLLAFGAAMLLLVVRARKRGTTV
jgi:hypothetical protein